MKFLFMSLQTLGALRNGIHNQLRASTAHILVFEKKKLLDEKNKGKLPLECEVRLSAVNLRLMPIVFIDCTFFNLLLSWKRY